MEPNVVATLKIMPEDTSVDLESVKGGVEDIVEKFESVSIHSTAIKPIAFGLNCLEVVILLNDSEGGMDEIESKTNELEGVGSVEVSDVNRL